LLLAALEIVDLVAVDLTAPREYMVEKAEALRGAAMAIAIIEAENFIFLFY